MIIALAQINPVIGDLDHNCRKIAADFERARKAGADLVVFPELAVTGYPPKDLLLNSGFVEQNIRAVRELAHCTKNGPTAVVGFVARNEAPVGRLFRNAVALLSHGRLEGEFYKSLLPTYDVFDEHRYFEPAENAGLVEIKTGKRSIKVGLTICEDLWNNGQIFPRPLYRRNPMKELTENGAELVLNISASPFTIGKHAFREQLMGGHAAEQSIPLFFVNQLGGNDELLFDGASCVFDAEGAVVARGQAFAEDLLIVDTNNFADARLEPYPHPIESVWRGLVMGTRDYVNKCGFEDVVVGLSGGIDSAVTAVIAVEAIHGPSALDENAPDLAPSRVHGIAMPSRYSSKHSIRDADALARNLGIDYRVIPIEEIHATFESKLAPHFENRPQDIAEENIQARIRGNILMALSNKFGWLLLTTGNKSELAVGYCTLYGDMCGGLAVISDVPKTMVYQLARYINERTGREVIPRSTLTKVPSAELRPDQHDQQSLPPYDVLDAVLHEYIEEEKCAADIAAKGFDEAVVRDIIRMVDRNEYKRKQAATGLKVTSRAFGIGRRMPIAAKF